MSLVMLVWTSYGIFDPETPLIVAVRHFRCKLCLSPVRLVGNWLSTLSGYEKGQDPGMF